MSLLARTDLCRIHPCSPSPHVPVFVFQQVTFTISMLSVTFNTNVLRFPFYNKQILKNMQNFCDPKISVSHTVGSERYGDTSCPTAWVQCNVYFYVTQRPAANIGTVWPPKCVYLCYRSRRRGLLYHDEKILSIYNEMEWPIRGYTMN